MIKLLFNVLCLVVMTTVVAEAQQSQSDMQAQMNAAAAVHSVANNPTFATPLATYQQYYSALSGGHTQSMIACFTAAEMQSFTGGGTSLTSQQCSTIDSKWQQAGFSNFQLLSFIFTANATNPQITFQYSCTMGQGVYKEQVVLTLVDSTTGWLVNSATNQEQ